MSRADPSGSRRAREAALQMMYQCEVGRSSPAEAIASYWPAHDQDGAIDGPLREFADTLVQGATARVAEIDALLTTHAQNWRVERMAAIDRVVLRIAVFELLAQTGTPAKVVINEAIELVRSYTGDEAVGFVNGILDAVRKDLGRDGGSASARTPATDRGKGKA